MARAKNLMILGTGSDVGKSILVARIIRFLAFAMGFTFSRQRYRAQGSRLFSRNIPSLVLSPDS